MKSLILLILGVLYLSTSHAFDTNPSNSREISRCSLALQFLSQSQLQSIEDFQSRLKQQQALAEQNQVLLTQTAKALKNPAVLARIQENPEQASQITTKAIEDYQQEQRKKAMLAQIRENFPEDESTEYS